MDELFFLMFPHFIAPIAKSNNANRDVINVMPIAVDMSHHWKGEMFYSDSTRVLKKMVSQSSLGFSAVLIASLTGKIQSL